MICRICGYDNPAGATVCLACRHRLDPGISQGMNCPRCGELNPAGVTNCEGCTLDLEPIDRIPPSERTRVCPHCQTRNPKSLPFHPVYCIGCGRKHPNGSDASILAATPDRDECPVCKAKGIPVSTVFRKKLVQPNWWFAPPSKPLLLRLLGAASTEDDANYGENDDPLPLSDAAGEAIAVSKYASVFFYLLSGAWIAWLLAVSAGFVAARFANRRMADSLEFRRTTERWEESFYCLTDNLVFHRHVNDVEYRSPEGFQRWLNPEL
jgi:hypothetical protein